MSEVKFTDLLSSDEESDLREKYGEIVAVDTKAGVCVFKIPEPKDYRYYQKLLFDDKTKAAAFDYLLGSSVVKPTKEAFATYLEKYPAISLTCVNHVLELAGFDAEAQAKKYGPA